MSLTFAGVFSDAGALWQRERDVLLRIAGVFYFLPGLAVRLFVPVPEKLPEAEAGMEQLVAWWTANAHWFALVMLVTYFGSATLLRYLLVSREETLGETLAGALRVYPMLLLASLVSTILTFGGILLLILPGLYLTGRLFLLSAVVVAEPGHSLTGAVTRAFELSRGRGWLLFGMTLTVMIALNLAGVVIGGIEDALGPAEGGSMVAHALLELFAAAVTTASSLALLLLQAAAYRTLAESRHGM